ncbi:sensor histidine kinase [Marinobacterium nitratireducens]|uniref:histidine kinase n=1 Tax=Marinobacterium nitratireducens TaxID=518897 RepID=A0A917ZFG1_9GAMM|nr:sensor histidine kinase [Marinobacterium nitratireducens]GGO81818.1 sensor histidine kinase [Marinobacterium nitratireducens]
MWLRLRRPEPARWSIRRKLLLLTLMLLGVISIFALRAAQSYSQRAAGLSYDRLLTGAALQIAEHIGLHDGRVVVDLPRAAFETLALAPEDRVFYRVLGPGDAHITGYADLPLPAVETDVRHSGDAFRQYFFDAAYGGEPVRFLVLSRLLTETDFSGTIRIQLGQTTRARQALAGEISLRAVQLVAVLFLIALLLVSAGIWMTLRPLERLNRALAQRSPVDLSPLDVAVPREISRLVQTLNHLMLQLGGTLNRLQRFTSEAAHQIRTPLAGLRSQAQNARAEEDETLRWRQLGQVIESADRLSDTVDQLLKQAVLTHRLRSEQDERLALDELVLDVCRDLAVPALERDVELAYDGTAGIELRGNRFALRQMLQNLVENAIRYSEPGSDVQVKLQRDGSGVLLSVTDRGPGIPDAEKPLVFERFYRSPGNSRSGSGLGLAIVQEVAGHHRASLRLKDNTPQGLIVEVHFPSGRLS